MEQNNLEELLDTYRAGAEELIGNVRGLDPELLKFRPFAEAWTIQEHFIHTVDMEMNAILRMKMMFAETGRQVIVLDEDKWTELLDYNGEDIAEYFDLFRLLRTTAYKFLKRKIEVPEAWKNYVDHPKLGKLTVARWIELYSKHCSDHLQYIERNKRLWKEVHGSV